MDFSARCEVRGVTKVIRCHPLGAVSIQGFTAIWPVLVELSCCVLKCWTDGQANQLNTRHRRLYALRRRQKECV